MYDNRDNISRGIEKTKIIIENSNITTPPPPILTMSSKLDIIDSYTMRKYIQDDDKSDTNNLIHYKIKDKSGASGAGNGIASNSLAPGSGLKSIVTNGSNISSNFLNLSVKYASKETRK